MILTNWPFFSLVYIVDQLLIDSHEFYIENVIVFEISILNLS